MSSAEPTRRADPVTLVEGMRLNQPAFHALYEAAPAEVRAELIGGVVAMPSPVSYEHGKPHLTLGTWLALYEDATVGVQALDNASVILDDRSEPQPDVCLRLLPEYGGQTRSEGGYVVGAPELVVEVSRGTRYVDLGPKQDAYERAGVLEYVVFAVGPDEVIWQALDEGRYVVREPDADGLYRSRAFPGLWLDPAALLAGDRVELRRVLDRGLASPEHAAFVARLAAAGPRA